MYRSVSVVFYRALGSRQQKIKRNRRQTGWWPPNVCSLALMKNVDEIKNVIGKTIGRERSC